MNSPKGPKCPNRRDFLKVAAATAGTGLLLATNAKSALAAEEAKLPPHAQGLLYDSTTCVGCKACVSACKQANQLPPDFNSKDKLWDDAVDLSGKTLNVIKVYKDKDSDAYAFVKRQCMHCVDPACVSACPASAMTKNEDTGVVQYNKDKCIGCRYCQVACPYGIPRYEWDKAFPQIRKCELCRERAKEGKIPACAEACPTGATISGPTTDLLAEAKKRLAAKPGSEYLYPLNQVSSKNAIPKKVAVYQPQVYGEKEGGGTQSFILASLSFEKLGLPKLPEQSSARMSENLQHSIYKGMIAPATLFAGLLFAAYTNTKKEHKDDDQGGSK